MKLQNGEVASLAFTSLIRWRIPLSALEGYFQSIPVRKVLVEAIDQNKSSVVIVSCSINTSVVFSGMFLKSLGEMFSNQFSYTYDTNTCLPLLTDLCFNTKVKNQHLQTSLCD